MNLEEIQKDYNKILKELENPEIISDLERFENLCRRKKELEKIIEKQKEIEEIQNQIEENKAILVSGEDRELASLAESEIAQLQEKKKILEEEIKTLLENQNNSLSKEGASKPVIVEIRAGTGGQEAALFAKDLYKMYSKYALSQGWKEKILDSHPTELGGFKEIIFELTPTKNAKEKNIFSKMRYEAGVHRVQRIPETEKSGRIHTSTATVAVLSKPEPGKIKIRPSEIKIDFFHSSGPGGQNVNKRMTAVRITHLPTGIVATSQTERSQQQNKENAMAILLARILEQKEKEEIQKTTGERKAQIGRAERAEKIRTYNFPQNRVTDHRIKKSWHNIDEIMEGEIEPIIKSLQKNLNNK